MTVPICQGENRRFAGVCVGGKPLFRARQATSCHTAETRLTMRPRLAAAAAGNSMKAPRLKPEPLAMSNGAGRAAR